MGYVRLLKKKKSWTTIYLWKHHHIPFKDWCKTPDFPGFPSIACFTNLLSWLMSARVVHTVKLCKLQRFLRLFCDCSSPQALSVTWNCFPAADGTLFITLPSLCSCEYVRTERCNACMCACTSQHTHGLKDILTKIISYSINKSEIKNQHFWGHVIFFLDGWLTASTSSSGSIAFLHVKLSP